MLTDQQLQSLRNQGNEGETAADEIARLRWDSGELRGRIAQMERDEGKAAAAERERLRGLLKEALEADTNDYVFGSDLADRMRAALKA